MYVSVGGLGFVASSMVVIHSTTYAYLYVVSGFASFLQGRKLRNRHNADCIMGGIYCIVHKMES
jgi:hypothetical protein